VAVKTSRGDFNLIVYPPAASAAGPAASAADPERPLVLLASGEGGWRRFDVMIAGFLSDAGYWVGGMDAMKYFWEAQDDRQALAVDIRAYADALATIAGRKPGGPILLAGFSFGADLAPWVAGAGGWGDRLRGLILIGPDETGSLEFRIMEIMGFSPKDHIFSVAEALKSAAGVPVLFLHGEKDSNSAAPALATSAGEPKRIAVIPGADHHYSGKEEDLRRALLEGLDWIRSQKRPASQDVQKDP
jgi:type IV secretory pathway VirJ component